MRSGLSANTLDPAPNVHASLPGMVDRSLGQPATTSYPPNTSWPPFWFGVAEIDLIQLWAEIPGLFNKNPAARQIRPVSRIGIRLRMSPPISPDYTRSNRSRRSNRSSRSAPLVRSRRSPVQERNDPKDPNDTNDP